MKRECKEELGYHVQVDELIFVREGFNNAEAHRVEFMFHCTILGEVENNIPMPDTIQCGLEWLDINKLTSLPIYPEELRYQIKDSIKRKTQKYILARLSKRIHTLRF